MDVTVPLGDNTINSANDGSSSSAWDSHDIAAQFEVPPVEPSASFAALKDRIRHHYELASEYYHSLW